MTHRSRLVALALALFMGLPAAHSPTATASPEQIGRRVPTVQMGVGPGGFMSYNLSYVATIPLDAPGVGARVVTVGKQRRLYVTGVTGLSIYDVTDPGLPLILGHLQLPNWENEDVSVSKDGSTVLISADLGLYLHVIDASIVQLPRPVATLPGAGGHTVTCVDDPCNWVYGSEGDIIDLRDKSKPVLRPEKWTRMVGVRDSHNLERDAAGVVWADSTPIIAIDVKEPLRPVRLGSGRAPAEARTRLQHNNLRPRAREYRPRPAQAGFDFQGATDELRPGELLYATGETDLQDNGCDEGSGPFATYRVDGFERGGGNKVRLIDTFRPVTGRPDEGDAMVNPMACSSHWFTYNPSEVSLVAAGWYEHGTRLLRVNQKTGKIGQVGYFQPVVGAASAAYWIDASHIYVVDYERGIDILRYDATAKRPTAAEFAASWLAKAGVKDAASEAERLSCRLSVV